MRRFLETIGFIVAVLTLLAWFGVWIWGPEGWKIKEHTVVPWFLVGLAIILSWPFLCRVCSVGIKWLFRRIINVLSPELKDVIKDIRPESDLDYRLDGAKLMKEGYRHVSARVQTMQIILNGLADDATGQKLRKIGNAVGQNFVTTTWSQMEERVLTIDGVTKPHPEAMLSPKEAERRIALWARMEKTAGWGEVLPHLTFAPPGVIGTITILDCFLAIGRSDRYSCLCPFLEGYMESIISGLTGYKVMVREESCGRKFPADKNCIFRVSPLTTV